ncbi:MAG: hypothetical protein HY691_05910 [Chloroflexi bacterium]|nr:hypothetical protein [Chloroflexota bacterium]
MARPADKPVKLTVVLDDRALYRAVRHAAIEQDRPVREIVAEALRRWLEWYEEQEDLAAIAEVEGEETVPWEEAKARLEEHWAQQDAREAV